ncbi:MAG: apolipoprotein N-acyltransferase [Pseudomonadota bacterium]
MLRSRILWSVLAAVSSGLLTSLGFPRGLTVHNPLAWFIPVALVPLLIAIELLPTTYKSPARAHATTLRQVTPLSRSLSALGLLWIYGITLIAVAFHWVTVPAMMFGELPPTTTNLLFCVYCVLAGLYFPLLFSPLIWNASRSSRRGSPPFPVWALVFATTLLEIFIPRFFHWTYGNLMHGSLPVVQWASWIGASGLSLIIFASNFVLARAITTDLRKTGRIAVVIASVVAVWVSIFIFGRHKLETMRSQIEAARTTHVGFVQPNFRFPGLPRNPAYAHEATLQSMTSLLSLTQELIAARGTADKLDLIVWPESTASYDFAWSTPEQNLVKEKIKTWNVPLLVQAAEFDKAELETVGPRKATLYSISFLLRPDGSRSPSFRKWIPMPFGEAVPLEDTFPWLGDLVRDNVNNVSKLGRGTSFDALAYTPSDSVAPLICFDAIASELTRAQASRGNATLFVNQANFLWMWKSTAAYQFVQLGRFRAVENGRSFILSGNTGPSAAFSPAGELLNEPLGLMQRGYGSARLPVLESKTLYSEWGDLPHILLGVFGFLTLLILSRPQNRHNGR